MFKHETVKMTSGQIKELIAALVEAVPTDLSADVAQGWIGNKKALAKGLRKLLAPPDLRDLLAAWQKFYRDVFGIETDFSYLRIPEEREGFNRLLVMAQGMAAQQLYDKCSELFGIWKYTSENLDDAVPINDRTAENDHYAIWVRNRVEADEELKNKSANALEKENIPGITLTERLLYGLKFFKETGEHLDIKNFTLCVGSRSADGDVPRVSWSPGCRWVSVRYYLPGDASGRLRSRETVS